MKKQEIISTVVYLLMILVVVLVGYFVISQNSAAIVEHFSNDSMIYLFVIVSLLLGVILNVVLVEVGHVIGAKIGGYEILSFNVFGLCFYKTYVEGKVKTKFGFKNFDGLAGETRIMPKNDNKKHSPTFYVTFPLLLILIEFIGLVIVFTLISDDSSLAFVKYGYVLIATLGGCFFIYDYIPFKLDTSSDGYRYTLLTKKINIEAFNEKMSFEGHLFLNTKADYIKEFDEITDYTAEVNELNLYRLIEEKDFNKANELLDKIINSEKKLTSYTLAKAKIWKLFILLKEDRIEDAKEFESKLSESESNILKKEKSLESLRTYSYFIGKVEKAYKFADELSIKYLKEYKNELSLVKELDKKLFENCIQDIESLKTTSN